ncbi:MAG: hypothetical protein Q7U04_09520 [Bacteriovorax sp.]|nr:hypothetical protein [Bacteriovorax sp.]
MRQPSYAVEVKEFRIIRLEDDLKSIKLQSMIEDLISKYDLSKLRFRRNLLVLKSGRPFSPAKEPSIYFFAESRSTDYTADKNRLLSTLIHEEYHAYLAQFPVELEKAKIMLMKLYPKEQLPSNKNEMADDLESTYLHLVVCWLEYDSIKKLLGQEEAKRIISTGSVYRWIYDRELESYEKIGAIIKDAGLLNPL